MKAAWIAILLLLICISIGSVDAKKVGASIAEKNFPSGDWHRGQTQNTNVWIKNTGDVRYQFWISYEVMDKTGRWYKAPPVSIWADPGTQTWNVNPRWHIPSNAMISSYQASFLVYACYDPHTGRLACLLDQVNLPNAFKIVK